MNKDMLFYKCYRLFINTKVGSGMRLFTASHRDTTYKSGCNACAMTYIDTKYFFKEMLKAVTRALTVELPRQGYLRKHVTHLPDDTLIFLEHLPVHLKMLLCWRATEIETVTWIKAVRSEIGILL